MMLFMPDHVHALAIPYPDKSIGRVVGNWKQYTAKTQGIVWQKNFFDHRIRSDESWCEKAAYIRNNPVRKGYVKHASEWKYIIEN
jgi:putative transposase